MMGKRIAMLAGLILAVGSMVPAVGRAGPIFGPYKDAPADCHPNLYSPCHYWTPALHRLHACWHGPKAVFDAPDRHPDVPPRFWITNYPCRSVDPVVITADHARSR